MGDLRTRTLPKGSSYWCVVERRFGAISFNPNEGGDPTIDVVGGRFHPFESPAGTPVPTKYLADHENGAIAETMMRAGRDPRTLGIGEIEQRQLAQLSLRRPIRLADLTVPGPDSALALLMRGDHRAYVPLRKIAATLHARHVELDGLLWEGRQLDQPGMKCLMLFGDRVSPEVDLAEVVTLALDSGTGLAMLRRAARLRRFKLPEALDRFGR